MPTPRPPTTAPSRREMTRRLPPETLGPAAPPAANFTASPAATLPVQVDSPDRPSLPGYEILGELGRGGMGVVYLARHLGLGRVVALKVILSGAHADGDDVTRFLAEAEAVAHLQHPNVVQIFESGRHGGLPFFTLEYVPGGSLADKVREAPLAPAPSPGPDMARSSKPADAPEDRWRKLTWDGLSVWAGSRSVERGRTYQRTGRVKDLRLDGGETLLAWVRGTERYATEVTLRTGLAGGLQLTSRCTCPVGATCKHAVAVALEYLEALKEGTPVPAADKDDERRERLDAMYRDDDGADADDEYEEDYGDDYEEDYEEDDDYEEEPPRRAAAKKLPVTKGAATLRAYLESLSPAALVDLIADLAGRHPEVQAALNDRAALVTGKAADLVKQTRKEIARVTAQEAWQDRWGRGGNIPDYSGIKRCLEQLLDAGEADAVLDLGKDLLERAIQQVETSNDEGETAAEVADCMAVVFRALPRSTLSGPEQVLYAIDRMQEDDYELCPGASDVLEAKWSKADWSAVADELARRLKQLPAASANEDYHVRYKRDHLSNWLMDALQKAGRGDEALAVCEAEALDRLEGRPIVEG